MALRDWLAATATLATSATLPDETTPTVATVATVAVATSANDEAARRWQVRYPGVGPMEVIFAPEATHAEVAALYPGARIDALPDDAKRANAPAIVAAATDDRRTCRQCANLTAGGRCLAALRGELSYVAGRNYSPMPDLPCRCAGYLPRPVDPDQRPGQERWPGIDGRAA